VKTWTSEDELITRGHETMRTAILGVLGAQGCGKTALVRALTGEETDRLPEEQERGLSIEVGFVVLELADGSRVSVADLPGHEKYSRHLIAGLAKATVVLLVIAADQGVMPQSREHLAICRMLGIRQGCMVITGIDQVEPELLAMVVDETRDLARGSFLQEAPVFPLSTVNGDGVNPLRAWLASLSLARAEAKGAGSFRMPVDRLFTLPDGGLVVTGAVLAGQVRQGDSLLLYPKMLPARVLGIQSHHRKLEAAAEGSRAAVNLQGLDETMVERGDVLATPGCLAPSHVLDVDFSLLASHPEPFRNRTAVRVHLGAAELAGHIVLLATDELPPGCRAAAQLFLEEPAMAWPGDHFLVRSFSPPLILGGGVVYNGVAHRRKRQVPADIFIHYRRGNAEEVAVCHVRESGFQGLTMPGLAQRMGISEKRARKLLEASLSNRQVFLIGGGSQQLIARDTVEAMKKRCVQLLASFHDECPEREGLSVEELRRRVYGGMDPMLMRLILDELAKSGSTQTIQEAISLSPGRPLSDRVHEWLRHELTGFYHDSALAPPSFREVKIRFPRQGPEILRTLLDSLVEAGVLRKVSEELYFHHEALDALRDRLVQHLREHGKIDMQESKVLTGMTRRLLVPVLEYFDATGVTERQDDNTRKPRAGRQSSEDVRRAGLAREDVINHQ